MPTHDNSVRRISAGEYHYRGYVIERLVRNKGWAVLDGAKMLTTHNTRAAAKLAVDGIHEHRRATTGTKHGESADMVLAGHLDIARRGRAIAAAIAPSPDDVASLLDSASEALDWATTQCETQNDTEGATAWRADRDAMDAVAPALVLTFNTHDALVAALCIALARVEQECQRNHVDPEDDTVVIQARAALRQARGEA